MEDFTLRADGQVASSGHVGREVISALGNSPAGTTAARGLASEYPSLGMTHKRPNDPGGLVDAGNENEVCHNVVYLMKPSFDGFNRREDLQRDFARLAQRKGELPL